MLCDINMPVMDGLTLLAEVAKLSLTLKTIMVTAYGDMNNIRMAMNNGAFDFLTKPIELKDLDATISKGIKLVNQLKDAERSRLRALSLEERNIFIRNTFGRYLSEGVVASLLDHPEGLRIGGEKRKIPVLMSDLRGFTALTEQFHPEQVIAILNLYLETMIDIILAYQGTIIEIMGDGILVVFGAPLEQPDAAQRAMSCALAMQLAMPDFNRKNRRDGVWDLEMAIGINLGDVVVGNIGSEKRAKYTVVGSTINLASRIESYATGDQILISESLFEELREKIIVRQSFGIKPKGARHPMEVYDVIGFVGDVELALPDFDQQMIPLPRPWPITYAVLNDKIVNASICHGQIVALSSKLARLSGSQLPEFLANIKLTLPEAPAHAGDSAEIYAKIIEPVKSDNKDFVTIRFTAVTPAAAAAIGRCHNPDEHCGVQLPNE